MALASSHITDKIIDLLISKGNLYQRNRLGKDPATVSPLIIREKSLKIPIFDRFLLSCASRGLVLKHNSRI